ncbi:MAG: hypothetical protein ACRYG7_49965 [Janthinobacterium lividum]
MNYVPIAAAVLVMVVLLGAGSRWLHSAAPARVAGGQPLAPAGPAPALVVSTLAGQPPHPPKAMARGLRSASGG